MSYREQTRRDAAMLSAELHAIADGSLTTLNAGEADRFAATVDALLAELEQAELCALCTPERDHNGVLCREHANERLEQTERERDLAREEVRLREESQIPVIPRAAAERLSNAEARLAKVPPLVKAMRQIARWGYEFDGTAQTAKDALAAWEDDHDPAGTSH